MHEMGIITKIQLDHKNVLKFNIDPKKDKIKIISIQASDSHGSESLLHYLDLYRQKMGVGRISVNILKLGKDYKKILKEHGFRKVYAYKPWEWWWFN